MLVKYKIIHASDLHLGYPFLYLPNQTAQKRRDDLKEIFGQIIDLAQAEDVPLLLWAGDLFHQDEYLDEDLSRFVREGFATLNNTKVLISPGDSDPATPYSFYSSHEWPANVHIFKNGWEKISLDDFNINVYGYGLQGKEEDPLEAMKKLTPEDPQAINIMLIHTHNEKNPDNPIHPLDLQLAGVHYAALGHSHKHELFKAEDRIIGSYPGSPEPLEFSAEGSRGINMVTFNIQTPQVHFTPISRRQHFNIELEVTDIKSIEEILEKIKLVIPAEKREKDLFKVTLTGALDIEINLNTEHLEKAIANDFFHVELQDNTYPDYNLNNFLKEKNIKSAFILRMKNLLENEEAPRRKRVIEKALYYGLDAFLKEKVKLR